MRIEDRHSAGMPSCATETHLPAVSHRSHETDESYMTYTDAQAAVATLCRALGNSGFGNVVRPVAIRQPPDEVGSASLPQENERRKR
jgi:hypothetical protein